MLIPKAFMFFLPYRVKTNRKQVFKLSHTNCLVFTDFQRQGTAQEAHCPGGRAAQLSHRKDGWVFQAEQTRHTAVKERVGFI